MSKTLFATGGTPRLLAPTTTTKMAHRMLAASAIVAARLPRGASGSPALDLLLSLYVAEEDARYLSIGDLALASAPVPAVVERWTAYLVDQGLVERRDDLLALTVDGHTAVTDLIEEMFAAQRALD